MSLIVEEIDEILQPENIEISTYAKMNPDLNMLGMFDKKNNKGKDTFAFARNETNAEELILQGIMKEPVEIMEASQLPQVKIKGINRNVGKMRRIGFEAEFTEEVLRDSVNEDRIQLTTELMGFAMARTLNRHAYTVLTQAGSAPTITLGNGSWATPGNEEIDNDIKKIIRAFADQEGYDYNITDMFVSKESYWGAEDYYESVNDDGFNPNNVRGATLKRINELESGLIGIDMNLKPAKWYYNIYPEDNLLHDKFGSFVHINRVDKLKEIPRTVKIQMYVEYGFAVLEPKGVVFQEGI